MMPGPALPCPRCQRVLGPESWIDATSGVCHWCKTEYEFLAFPGLTAKRAPVAPQAAVLAADSVCYFHAGNRAETICEGCGRLLCAVCTVPFAGHKLCPACIAATRKSGATAVTRSRVLLDGIALALAGLPLVVFPLTALTAPLALGLVVFGWNKPGSLVRGRGRVRFIIAGILALIEIAGWVIFLLFWWLKK